MEPSHPQMVGAAEECHSCESGWTMYLGSPTHDDVGDHSDDDEEGEEDRKGGADAEDGESDDSMASDASTAPSQPIGSPWGYSKGSQLVKEDVAAAAATTKEKEIAEKKVEKREVATFIVDKVRKNHCIRKRK